MMYGNCNRVADTISDYNNLALFVESMPSAIPDNWFAAFEVCRNVSGTLTFIVVRF